MKNRKFLLCFVFLLTNSSPSFTQADSTKKSFGISLSETFFPIDFYAGNTTIGFVYVRDRHFFSVGPSLFSYSPLQPDFNSSYANQIYDYGFEFSYLYYPFTRRKNVELFFGYNLTYVREKDIYNNPNYSLTYIDNYLISQLGYGMTINIHRKLFLNQSVGVGIYMDFFKERYTGVINEKYNAFEIGGFEGMYKFSLGYRFR